MRASVPAVVLLVAVGCGGNKPPGDVKESVRRFMAVVAHDVTAEGPVAWRRHFADDPDFFMVANGELQLPDSAAATRMIDNLARTIRHIDLEWSGDLRVDPLAPNIAVVGVPFHEVMVSADGGRIEARGYFTGTTEYRAGRWQFRNVHWSVPVPAAR